MWLNCCCLTVINFIILCTFFNHHDALEDSVKSKKKANKNIPADCSNPLVGQYNCSEPLIDPDSQQPVNCDKNNKAQINCTLYEGFFCHGTPNVTSFTKEIDCLYTNGYHFETALLLSIFLGKYFKQWRENLQNND